ncbi:MAG: hypothetical protein GEU93_11470 [Propionibacteriales bacterium]|nr:hypothetical protein [Propionibacteriales bacterium]
MDVPIDDLLESVGSFLDREVPFDAVEAWDQDHRTPYDFLPRLANLGLFGIPFPAHYGGYDAPWTVVSHVQEQLAHRWYALGSILSRVVAFGGMSLTEYGSEAQRETHLPDLISGKRFFTLALSEPDAGSDVGAVRTRARRSDRGWVVTGRKTWISDAQGASHLVTVVRTDAHSSGTKGLSVLLIPSDAQGVSMSVIPKVGNNSMPSFDIGFDDVEVPEDALMGTEGHGMSHLSSTLHYSRASVASTTVGAAQRAVDVARQHSLERIQFGRALATNQVIRHRLVDMQIKVDLARLTARHLAHLISTGADSRRWSAIGKTVGTETLQFVTDHGMQILASAGYTVESPMQRIWRDARLFSFGEGSNEIQRELIARHMGIGAPL